MFIVDNAAAIAGIATKADGDQVSASEFNAVVGALVEVNAADIGDLPAALLTQTEADALYAPIGGGGGGGSSATVINGTSVISVNNTVTPTLIMDVTVAESILGTAGHVMRYDLFGTMKNSNAGASASTLIEVKLAGSIAVKFSPTIGADASGTHNPWRMKIVIMPDPLAVAFYTYCYVEFEINPVDHSGNSGSGITLNAANTQKFFGAMQKQTFGRADPMPVTVMATNSTATNLNFSRVIGYAEQIA